jgi:hypothetical protein
VRVDVFAAVWNPEQYIRASRVVVESARSNVNLRVVSRNVDSVGTYFCNAVMLPIRGPLSDMAVGGRVAQSGAALEMARRKDWYCKSQSEAVRLQ